MELDFLELLFSPPRVARNLSAIRIYNLLVGPNIAHVTYSRFSALVGFTSSLEKIQGLVHWLYLQQVDELVIFEITGNPSE